MSNLPVVGYVRVRSQYKIWRTIVISISVEPRALVAVVLQLQLSIQLNMEIAVPDGFCEPVLLLSLRHNEDGLASKTIKEKGLDDKPIPDVLLCQPDRKS